MQFWDLKMSKTAVADCSGVGDVVMPKPSFTPRPPGGNDNDHLIASYGHADTSFGQFNASPDAVKKLCVVSILQCRDRYADGGLSKIKRFSRFRQMLSFGDGDEDTKLVKCHPVHSYDLQRTFSEPGA